MRFVIVSIALALAWASVAAAQFNRRTPLTPAETLLEPAILRAIDEAVADAAPVRVIEGTDAAAGDILLDCREGQCDAAMLAARKLQSLIVSNRLPQPSRSIRVISTPTASGAGDFLRSRPELAQRARAALHIGPSPSRVMQVVRAPWSTASIADEVVEILATRETPGTVPARAAVRAFEGIGQPFWDAYGIPTTAILAVEGDDGQRQAASLAAASAYFLATLPNAGAEALLSHLTVGAHARLAEDGRKAVAQMGLQQRASADVLIMFGQAIEREQRRMRSFERFMPTPVDPMLLSRLADMERGITSVWTSMGITSSPFVPAARRIRGRGGEDLRVASRTGQGPLPTPNPPTAMLKFANVADIIYELGNFIDGQRSISDIRDAVSAEFGPIDLPVVADYFERLSKTGAVTLR